MKSLEVIPAIDLMDKNVVRITKGDPEKKTIYSMGDPIEVAKLWTNQGAKHIHIIDLDAALGRGDNKEIIIKIAKEIQVKLQVGGGIRSYAKAHDLLNRGIDRIILGSLAINDRGTLQRLIKEYDSERIVVSLDHSGGYIRIEGWRRETEFELAETMKTYYEMGVKIFLVTNIERDGTLEGPDLKTLEILPRPGLKLIAAGGVRDIGDLIELRKIGVDATVVGKALYDGGLDLSAALASMGCL